MKSIALKIKKKKFEQLWKELKKKQQKTSHLPRHKQQQNL